MKHSYNEKVTCPNCAGYILVPMCHKCCGTGELYDIFTFKMSDWFGKPIVAPKPLGYSETADVFIDEVNKALQQSLHVQFDFEGITIMTHDYAKRLFGSLYQRLGGKDFLNRIFIEHATSNIQTIIKEGIISTIDITYK